MRDGPHLTEDPPMQDSQYLETLARLLWVVAEAQAVLALAKQKTPEADGEAQRAALADAIGRNSPEVRS